MHYTFSAKEKDSESGYNYFGARYYTDNIMMWLSVDPMSDERPWISPYNYCQWNPIGRVDTWGMLDDEWEINKFGKIVNHIETAEHDAFYMVDDDGNRIEGKSISFKYGTIEKKFSWNNSFASATYYYAKEESKGADLFKFFADNTEVEFGLVNTETNGTYIMTIHDKSRVPVGKFARMLNERGRTIKDIIHSHPGNSNPSGFKSDPNGYRGENRGDGPAARKMVTSHGNKVNYYVYKPGSVELVPYDGNKIYEAQSWQSVFGH